MPSLLLIADEQIDAEQYDEAEQTLAKVAAVNPHPSAGRGLQAVLAHLRNQLEARRCIALAALRHWPTNPEVDHLIGKKLSQKYRFAEGEKYQRQALKFDPKYRAGQDRSWPGPAAAGEGRRRLEAGRRGL